MNKFEQLEAFVAVVDRQGFSAAGDHLGIAKSILSRRVSELEKRLGVRLLHRTTRQQSLTDSGRHFYQRAQALLSDLDEAEQLISDTQVNLSGRIKLAVPLGIGISQLSLPISSFMKAHREIEIDIVLDDRVVDLVAEGFDMAVRIGRLQDSSLVARKLASVEFAVCASKDYLQQYGEPLHPSDLSEHEVMIYSNIVVGQQWQFLQGNKRLTPQVKHRLSANNGELLASAASHGLGITAGPLFYLQDYIDRGDLVPILQSFPVEAAGMYAIYPSGRLVSRRVKSFSDYLHEYFRDQAI
ncbi:MAG: DNA-binding transcriptional LysR family regulator [Planctomycetota bacterium]|jgi:DNA-binding transcriptional LysR family regulator